MRPVYLIYHRRQPHVVLFTAKSLEAAAECITAQPNREDLAMFASDGGVSRELTSEEHQELARIPARTGAAAVRYPDSYDRRDVG